MKDTYVYYNHKYHPIHVDLFTDYFKDVQNGNVDPLLTTIQLLKMQLNKNEIIHILMVKYLIMLLIN